MDNFERTANEVAGMLAEIDRELTDYQKQLDSVHNKLINEQYTAAQNEIWRVSHNIGVTAGFIGKAHAKLITGGKE